MCGKGWLPPYCSARSGNSWFHLKNENAGIDCSSACRGELNELAFPYAAGLNGEVYILLVPLKEYQSRRHTGSVLNSVLLGNGLPRSGLCDETARAVWDRCRELRNAEQI